MTPRPKKCARCGQTHERCTGHVDTAGGTKPGRPCRLRPIRGGTVCHKHGGSAGQVKAKAKKRIAVAEARDVMVTYGAPIDVDPIEFVLGEVRRAAGHVAFLEATIRAMAVPDLVWGMTKLKEGGDDRGVTFEAKPSIWLVMYADERKRGLEAAKIALAAGYEERRVQLAERLGAAIGTYTQRLLTDPRLQIGAKPEVVAAVVSEHMRAMDEAA